MNTKDDIIRLMINKAKDKLKTAKIDFDNGQYDDSVSRAYYAIFHALSAVLFYKGFQFTSHSQVIGMFNKQFVKTNIFPKNYTKIVHRIFEERQIGDYDIESSMDKKTALMDINDAEQIIKAIEQYMNI